MKEINEQLRKMVRGENYTTFIEKTGMYQSQVSIWLNGYDFMTISTLNRVAEYFGKAVAFEGVKEVENCLLNIIKNETVNYSILQLEKKTHVSFKTFYNLRTGNNNISLSTMIKILNAFDIEVKFELV